MQTASDFGTFEPEIAELPHLGVAIALTQAAACAGDVPESLARKDTGLPANEHDEPDGLGPMLQRAKTGDRRAIDALLSTVRPRAMAAALKVLRDRDDAEDAVQDAMLKVWRALGAFEGRASFTTWIHRVVTNASLDLLRRKASRPGTVDKQHAEVEGATRGLEPVEEQTPETALLRWERGRLIRSAIAALPAPQRQTVELRELEECSYQEIATVIRCPIGTVMSRLHHARSRLAIDLGLALGDGQECLAA